MPSYFISDITGQARIKGHLSAQFVKKKYIKRLIFVINISNMSIKQNIRKKDVWAQQTEGNIDLHWRKYVYSIVS